MAEHTPGPWTYREPPESLDRPIAYWVDGPGAGGAMPIADIVTNIAQAEANARLIAASPDLLAAAKALLQRGPVGIESECHWCGREGEDTEHCSSDDCMGTLARVAIAKAEGWLVCQDGQHRCFNTDQPCGCRCDDCRDDTEPRCDICNGLINKYGSAIGHCENESDHSGRVHQDPRLRFGPPLDTCIDCMEEEASDHTNTRIQVGAGYIIVDREECQSMRHVEEGE